jgi:hypothetical protein
VITDAETIVTTPNAGIWTTVYLAALADPDWKRAAAALQQRSTERQRALLALPR